MPYGDKSKNKWWKSMVDKFGSPEAVKEEMKRRQEKSMLNPNRHKGKHRGGFSDPEFAKKAGEKGRAVRFNKDSN